MCARQICWAWKSESPPQVIDEARHVEAYSRLLHEKFQLAYPITPMLRSLLQDVLNDSRWDMTYLGRLSLRDYYPQLSQAERDEREEFAVEACYAMRDRFLAEEVWERLGLPVAECAEHTSNSRFIQGYRSDLFTRILPMMKDIGLWGPKIRKAYEQMGIIGYCDTDVEKLSANDQVVAEQFEREIRERMAEIQSVAAV